MAYRLARAPRTLAVRGLAAVAFAVVTFAWPTMTVAAFARCFAVFALVDGVLSLVPALRSRARARDPRGPRDPLFVLGAAGVTVGVATALWPDVTMQTVLALMALWAAVAGGAQLALAVRARTRLPGAWLLLGGAGAAGVALALLLALALASGDVRVGWEVTAYGLGAGALLLGLAWRLRVAAARLTHGGDEPAPVGAVAAEAAP